MNDGVEPRYQSARPSPSRLPRLGYRDLAEPVATERSWLTSSDPVSMLQWLRGSAQSTRRLRLFACAYGRLLWPLLAFPQSRQAVCIAERCADDQALAAGLWEAREAAWSVEGAISPARGDRSKYAAGIAAAVVADDAWDAAFHAAPYAPTGSTERDEAECADYLRDIFGTPFRPVAIDPHWLTASVTSLAQAIYKERAFDRLPILADALEDAGCHDADILAHCRGPGPHVRGCWVVDLLTGRE